MNKGLSLIQSTPSDLAHILKIIAEAQELLKVNKIDQWQNGYPNESQISSDIASGDSFVVINSENRIVATVFLTTSSEPTYQKVYKGGWLTPLTETYGTIHRLAVSAEERGKGIAKWIISECEKNLQKQNISNLKIDTHPNNKGMQSLIGKLGYQYCGEIILEDGALRLAYEKNW